MDHQGIDALMAGLDEIRRSPKNTGRIELIVRRPGIDEREVIPVAALRRADGLVGDTWRQRGNRHTEDGSSDPGKQLTLMNARVAALVAGAPERWQLAGDQLYVDFDLSTVNAPPGTRLAVGSAVVEISDHPHRGCAKFAGRFGRNAVRFVNSDVGCELNLRGVNAQIVVDGSVRAGDPIRKLETSRTDEPYSVGATPTGQETPVPPSPQ